MSFVAGWMVSGSPKEPDGALTRIDFRNSNGKPIFRQGIDRLPKWPLLSGPLDPEHRIGTLQTLGRQHPFEHLECLGAR